MRKLEGYLKAIEVAGAVRINPALAEAADGLIADAQAAGGPSQPQPTNQTQGGV